jgi:hypothetical protein
VNEEMHTGAVWTLRQHNVVHGTITITEQDFPWLHGRWEPSPSFREIADLFEAELQLSQANIDADINTDINTDINADINDIDAETDADIGGVEDWDQWELAYDAIVAAGIRLHYPSELEVPEFLLHIENDTAWFRWSDEKFEE